MENSRGFTLVELMIVVAIVGMLTAVGSLSIIGARPTYQLQSAAREMTSSFRLARSMAIKFNRPVVLEFDTNGNFYTLDKGGTSFRRIPPKGTLSDHYGSGVALGYPGRSDKVHFTVGKGGADAGDAITFSTMGLTNNVEGYVYIQNRTSGDTGAGFRVGVSGMAAIIKMDRCKEVDCTKND